MEDAEPAAEWDEDDELVDLQQQGWVCLSVYLSKNLQSIYVMPHSTDSDTSKNGLPC